LFKSGESHGSFLGLSLLNRYDTNGTAYRMNICLPLAMNWTK